MLSTTALRCDKIEKTLRTRHWSWRADYLATIAPQIWRELVPLPHLSVPRDSCYSFFMLFIGSLLYSFILSFQVAAILENSSVCLALTPGLPVLFSGDCDEVTQKHESRAVACRPRWSRAPVLRLLACPR